MTLTPGVCGWERGGVFLGGGGSELNYQTLTQIKPRIPNKNSIPTILSYKVSGQTEPKKLVYNKSPRIAMNNNDLNKDAVSIQAKVR